MRISALLIPETEGTASPEKFSISRFLLGALQGTGLLAAGVIVVFLFSLISQGAAAASLFLLAYCHLIIRYYTQVGKSRAFGMTGICVGTIITLGLVAMSRPSRAKLAMTIKVVDQYGDAVAGAPVMLNVVYQYGSSGALNGFCGPTYPREESKLLITSDSSGMVSFDSAARKVDTLEIHFESSEFKNADGNRYVADLPDNRLVQPNEVWLQHYKTGWSQSTSYTNSELSRKSMHDGEQVLLKVYRVDQMERLVRLQGRLQWNRQESYGAWLDVTTGEWKNQPCSNCDLAIHMTQCGPRNSGAAQESHPRYAMELQATDGGVQAVQPAPLRASDLLHVPESGFMPTLLLREKYSCTNEFPAIDKKQGRTLEQTPLIYFTSRRGMVNGWIAINELPYPGHTGEWSWLTNIVVNPSGSHNLYSGDKPDIAVPFSWPLPSHN